MNTRTQHTAGPWTVDHECISANGAHISMAIGPDNSTYAEQCANAARIAACINACEGISTESLDSYTRLLRNCGETIAERDEFEAECIRLNEENKRLREALRVVANQCGHVAEALRVDGRMVGAYTKAAAMAHCLQIEEAARAALAGGA